MTMFDYYAWKGKETWVVGSTRIIPKNKKAEKELIEAKKNGDTTKMKEFLSDNKNFKVTISF